MGRIGEVPVGVLILDGGSVLEELTSVVVWGDDATPMTDHPLADARAFRVGRGYLSPPNTLEP
jgi:hypothetical protein